MKKAHITLAIVFLLALGSIAAGHGNGGGPHDRATGDVAWTSPTNVLHETSFNAHSGAPGKKSQRGTVVTTNTETGVTHTINVTCVRIDDDEAWFGGNREADGAFVIFYAREGGTPGSNGDSFNQWTNNTGGHTCGNLGSWSSGAENVREGNLKVHSR